MTLARQRAERFSALQRAEIAEIEEEEWGKGETASFSALQRAEIAEMPTRGDLAGWLAGFSALQRAEIAEIERTARTPAPHTVSVLFNEPKLLKLPRYDAERHSVERFSALQRAEIAEIMRRAAQQARG